jgi:hypothetical protein
MKAKDYAVSLGLAKAGKGRMSREAHAAIRDAIDNKGMTFPDYVYGGGTIVAGIAKPAAKPAKDEGPKDSAVSINVYAAEARRYPEDQVFLTVPDRAGKRHKVNGRQACMSKGAHYSIAGCFLQHTHSVLTNTLETLDVTPVGE